MKTIVIVSSILMLSAKAVNAQSESGAGRDERETKRELRKTDRAIKRNGLNVSYMSRDNFMRDFPDAKNVSWNAGEEFDEATFTTKNISMTAYYDINNQLVGTTIEKTFDDIPVIAQEHIKKYYKEYTPGEVIMFDDNENNDTDMTLYNLPFEDEDNYFVSLKNDKEAIVLKVNMEGSVSFFKKL